MPSPALSRFLLCTCCHALLTLALIFYAFYAGMAEFDNPALPPSRSAAIAGDAAGVLSQPLRLVWGSRANAHLPEAVEWVAFLSNSALWALGLTFLVRRGRTMLERGRRQ